MNLWMVVRCTHLQDIIIINTYKYLIFFQQSMIHIYSTDPYLKHYLILLILHYSGQIYNTLVASYPPLDKTIIF